MPGNYKHKLSTPCFQKLACPNYRDFQLEIRLPQRNIADIPFGTSISQNVVSTQDNVSCRVHKNIGNTTDKITINIMELFPVRLHDAVASKARGKR